MEVKTMLGTCQVGKTSHPRDLTPGRTAATPSRCLHHSVPTLMEECTGTYSKSTHTHIHCSVPIRNPPPSHTHAESQIWQAVDTNSFALTGKAPNTHIRHIQRHIIHHFIFLHPLCPELVICSHSFNDMLWEWPIHSVGGCSNWAKTTQNQTAWLFEWVPALHANRPQCETRGMHTAVFCGR